VKEKLKQAYLYLLDPENLIRSRFILKPEDKLQSVSYLIIQCRDVG